MQSTNDPSDENRGFSIDLRPADITHGLSALRKYREVMEAQMVVAKEVEIASMEAERPPGQDEMDHSIYSGWVISMENLFDEDLIPAMRYSFVVMSHSFFEKQLHWVCDVLKKDQAIPIAASDLRDSPIRQAECYLDKFCQVIVRDYPQWSFIRNVQTFRNCIVHANGILDPDEPRLKHLKKFLKTNQNTSVTGQNQVLLEAQFCADYLDQLKGFFKRLMSDIGWEV